MNKDEFTIVKNQQGKSKLQLNTTSKGDGTFIGISLLLLIILVSLAIFRYIN